MAEIKFLGAGSPMLDLLVNVDDAFIESIDGEKGGMVLVSPRELDTILSEAGADGVKTPGGSAANTIFGLTMLGVSTSILGKTGDDEEGKFYRSQYLAMGGDTSRFKLNADVPTGRCLSLVTPDSERTMRTDLGAAATLSIDDVTPEDFKEVSYVHIEGYLLFNTPLAEHILKLASDAGCVISLDLASFEVVQASGENLKDFLAKYVDIVFANEDEASAFCGTDDPEKCLDILGGYCRTAAVKVGKKGSYIKSGNETVKVSALLVDAVDTTGAGDLWASGFLYGFQNGKSLEKCGEYASIVSSEVVQVMGAAIPDEGWERIREKIG